MTGASIKCMPRISKISATQCAHARALVLIGLVLMGALCSLCQLQRARNKALELAWHGLGVDLQSAMSAGEWRDYASRRPRDACWTASIWVLREWVPSCGVKGAPQQILSECERATAAACSAVTVFDT